MTTELHKSLTSPGRVNDGRPRIPRTPFQRSKSVPENVTHYFYAPQFMDDHGPHQHHIHHDSDEEIDECDDELAVVESEKDVEITDEVRGGIRNEVDIESRSGTLERLKSNRSRREKDTYLVSALVPSILTASDDERYLGMVQTIQRTRRTGPRTRNGLPRLLSRSSLLSLPSPPRCPLQLSLLSART